MDKAIANTAPFRVGQWLPSDHETLTKWMATLLREVDAEEKSLHPVIEDFKQLIENDPEIFMLFHQMFEQVPRKPPYNKDPTGKPQVRWVGAVSVTGRYRKPCHRKRNRT